MLFTLHNAVSEMQFNETFTTIEMYLFNMSAPVGSEEYGCLNWTAKEDLF